MSEQERISHIARVRLITPESHRHLVDRLVERGYLTQEAASDHPPFFFDAEISNNSLDSHFTRMNEKTLKNYAEDAGVGVAFLKGHDHHSIPVGYSIESSFESGENMRTLASFYTITGLPETDDLIARIRSGLVRDVSVGFHGGQMVCDICLRDFWECSHWPGLKYEVKEGDVIRNVVATYTIDDARLSEVSGVFDGSTPNAMIIKAQRAAKAGDLSREQVMVLENKYRVSLPYQKSFAVLEVKEEETVNETLEKVRALLISSRINSEEELHEADEATVLSHFDKALVRLAQAAPKLAEYEEYREQMVKEAVAQAVRALGEVDTSTYEQMLRSIPTASIRQMRDDWKKTADKFFPVGRTSQESEERKTEEVAVEKPTASYKSR